MLSYFVRYQGEASDADQFGAYYETIHGKILREFPNIQSLHLHRPAPSVDPCPVNRGDSILLAQMIFRSSGDLDEALKSEARRKARDDFRRFPPFRGIVTHEAMSGKIVF
ncbi:MAG TPA: EthD family reductase [Xanthobacteraceae bacterium]|jgi:uncharacterized protein (TIGR02118 family)|nr:EthD family reductase [Xanthobacteraceae bacterium]